MPKVLFVAGLPGSGKSCYLGQVVLGGFRPFDDFKANAIDHSSAFTNSRHFESLVSALRNGQDCIVADIDFCRAKSRTEATDTIRRCVPQVEVEWHYFENDVEQCRLNIHARGRDSAQSELSKLDEFAPKYFSPADGVLLCVGAARPVEPSLPLTPGSLVEKKT